MFAIAQDVVQSKWQDCKHTVFVVRTR